MEHILGHFMAFLRSGSTSHQHVEKKSHVLGTKLDIHGDNSNASNEAVYESIEDQLAPFQYIGNIFKH